MSNWHDRYKEMKGALGWTNQDVADRCGCKERSVRTMTRENIGDDKFGSKFKAMVEVFESTRQMVFDRLMNKKKKGKV